jgi:FG-GAP repeat protein
LRDFSAVTRRIDENLQDQTFCRAHAEQRIGSPDFCLTHTAQSIAARADAASVVSRRTQLRASNVIAIAASTIAFISGSAAHAQLPVIRPSQPQVFPLNSDLSPPSGDQYWPAQLGSDVDIAGNVAIAGLPGSHNDEGRAAIWERNSSGIWNRSATLAPTSPIQSRENFGSLVAMGTDRAVVAGRRTLYLFVKQSSGAWKATQKLIFRDADLIADLDWHAGVLAVGVFGSGDRDHLYVYDTTSGSMRRVAEVSPSDAVKEDAFASRVAAYGKVVVATAPGYNGSQGAAYVYSCTLSACNRIQKLIAIAGVPGDQFGSAVDLNDSYVVIGAPGVQPVHHDWSRDVGPDNYEASGAAYVFTRAGGEWAETQKLRPTPEEWSMYASFGADITLQGPRVIVDSPYNGGLRGGPILPEADIFEYVLRGTTYTARSVLVPSMESGSSTSMVGQYVLVGNPNEPGQAQGSICFFKAP